ncbi:MAG: glycosyltransferase family 4 protein [Bdellovibrionota bacterium]|nr:glycosyltransferase family 4 protein [Bdellovibrionota bacterium]
MRVLFITVRADQGGGPKHLLDLARRIKITNQSSFIAIASPDHKPFYSHFLNVSNEVIKIPPRRFSLITFLRLLSFCKINEIHTVHSHGLGAGIYSRLLGLFSIHVIHTYHGVHLKQDFSSKLKNYVEKVLSKLDSTLIFVSNSERENAIRLNYSIGNNYLVIENGIHLKDLEKNVRFSNQSRIIKICILSRFDPHKNILQAIKLFSKAIAEFPNIHLSIAGHGPENRKIKNLIEKSNLVDYTSIYGEIEDSDAFLKEHHFYLSSSLGEGLPYTVLEAMKVGVIPILSNVSCHKDILNKSYLFSLNEEEQFISIFRDLVKRDPKSHNFDNILKTRFDIDYQIEKVIQLYYR